MRVICQPDWMDLALPKVYLLKSRCRDSGLVVSNILYAVNSLYKKSYH